MIDVASLIGTEWVEGESHCLAICARGLRMLKRPEASESLLGNDGSRATGWSKVSGHLAEGDIVVSAGVEGRKHVGMVYDPGKGVRSARVLTSSKRVGAFTCALRTVKNVEGIYRHGADSI